MLKKIASNYYQSLMMSRGMDLDEERADGFGAWQDLKPTQYSPKQMNIYNNTFKKRLYRNLNNPRFNNNINQATNWALTQTNDYMKRQYNIGSPTEWTNPVDDYDAFKQGAYPEDTTNSTGTNSGTFR